MGAWRTLAAALALACAATAPAETSQAAARGKSSLPLPSHSAEDLAPGRLLVASRQLSGLVFTQSVVLLIEYAAGGGALGLILNRPTEIPVEQLLPEVSGLAQRGEHAWLGGPVEIERMMLLIGASESPAGAQRVLDGVFLSVRLEALRAALAVEDQRFRAYLGYAGWGPGQLEGEMNRGDWFVAPANAQAIFARDATRLWKDLILRSESLEVRRQKPPFENPITRLTRLPDRE